MEIWDSHTMIPERGEIENLPCAKQRCQVYRHCSGFPGSPGFPEAFQSDLHCDLKNLEDNWNRFLKHTYARAANRTDPSLPTKLEALSLRDIQ